MLVAVKNKKNAGFALPTVLLASTVLLTVLVVSVTAAVSVNTTIRDQYQRRLAQEAAEAGVARAVDCLKTHGYEVTWTNSKPLRPHTDCSGNPVGTSCSNTPLGSNDAHCFVLKTDTVATTFTVPSPVKENIIEVNALATQLRNDGGAARSSEVKNTSRLSSVVGVSKVIFGYSIDGAYFATIAGDGGSRTVGYNGWGQLGNGTSTSSTVPVEFQLPDGQYAVDMYTNFLSLGYNLFAITTNGDVYGAGLNDDGQLGDGTTTNRSTPVRFGLPAGENAIYVGALGNRTYVLTDAGSIYAAGDCAGGALGDGQPPSSSSCSDRSTPVKVQLPAGEVPTTNIVLDSSSAVVRMQSGKVYGWGKNDDGQLGTGNTNDLSVPVQIGTFGNTGQPKAVQVAFDGVTTYVLTDEGKVYVTGRGEQGQLGFMPTTSCGSNRCITSLAEYANGGTGWQFYGETIEQISIDQWSVLFRTNAGTVWGSGHNNAGQLGNGNTTNQTAPVNFPLPYGVKAKSIYQASTGNRGSGVYNTSFVVATDGSVYGAGSNAFGQLGNGSTAATVTSPVRMQVFGSAIKADQVKAGFGTTVILTEGGKVYTVGNNSDGQLGDGTTTNSSTPKANKYTNIIPITQY